MAAHDETTHPTLRCFGVVICTSLTLWLFPVFFLYQVRLQVPGKPLRDGVPEDGGERCERILRYEGEAAGCCCSCCCCCRRQRRRWLTLLVCVRLVDGGGRSGDSDEQHSERNRHRPAFTCRTSGALRRTDPFFLFALPRGMHDLVVCVCDECTRSCGDDWRFSASTRHLAESVIHASSALFVRGSFVRG